MEEKHFFISGHLGVEEHISSEGLKESKRIKKRTKQNRSLFVTALAFFSLSFATLCAASVYLDSNKIIPDSVFAKIILVVALFFVVGLIFVYFSKKSKSVAILSILVCLVVMTISVYGSFALFNVYKSVEAVESPKVFYAQIGVYVRKDSVYAPNEISTENGSESQQMPGESLEGRSVGTIITNLDKGYTSQGMRLFRKEVDVSVTVYDSIGLLINALKSNEVDAIVINEAFLSSFLDDEPEFFTWAVESRNIGIETEHIINTVKADVVSEPFIVYVSGIDTANNNDKVDYFPDAARCDGNIIAAIDPINKRILLVSIPRDFYVPLWGNENYMDKLTHAGIFGVECSMETLGALFDIEFNYYVRLNVFSVIKIVDALGGITVHSDYDFSARYIDDSRTYFHVGENDLDGARALAFVRERYSFANGDRQRGIHQQECIRAIIEKACSPSIIAHFSDVLDVIENSVRTNIGQEEINALIRMQISDMASWSIESISVDGYGSSSPCYAMGGEMLYTMIPYYDTVETAKDAIIDLIS